MFNRPADLEWEDPRITAAEDARYYPVPHPADGFGWAGDVGDRQQDSADRTRLLYRRWVAQHHPHTGGGPDAPCD